MQSVVVRMTTLSVSLILVGSSCTSDDNSRQAGLTLESGLPLAPSLTSTSVIEPERLPYVVEEAVPIYPEAILQVQLDLSDPQCPTATFPSSDSKSSYSIVFSPLWALSGANLTIEGTGVVLGDSDMVNISGGLVRSHLPFIPDPGRCPAYGSQVLVAGSLVSE